MVNLTPQQISVYQQLKDDLPHYCRVALRIRSKSGSIEPLLLNKAQQYIHQELERQRGLTGKVRALILKGRQQGCCYSPNLKVLTSDYRWITLENIQIGEKIWAVDEKSLFNISNGRKDERRIRIATVEAKAYLKAEAYEVTLNNGVVLHVTGEHRHLCKQRKGCQPEWRSINDCIVGDYIRAFCCPPDNHEPDYEDGWFGGLLDGEGTFGAYPAARIGVSQVDGAVLRRIKKYLTDRNIKYYELVDERPCGKYTKFGSKFVHCIRVDRQADILKVLSSARPTRFVDKPVFEGKKLPKTCIGFDAWVKIESIKAIGEIDVIDLQTSAKTFICEGLVSHNSTYVGARFYHKVCYNKGYQAFIMAHEKEATDNLYQMAKRYYEFTPQEIKPELAKSNAKELLFGRMNSGYKLGTAENKKAGRSATIQLLHGSEVGYWNNAAEHAKGLLQAVPNTPGSEIILESTANGVGNYFHTEWQKAESGVSDFIAVFVPWFWQSEYQAPVDANFCLTPDEQDLKQFYNLTDEQLMFRRKKIIELSVAGTDGAKAFQQEYPMCAAEAFVLTGEDNYITAETVQLARKTELPTHYTRAYAPMVLGVDPARFGDDRSAIIRRRGRVAYGLQSYIKQDTMQIAGYVYQIILNEHPAKVCIDSGGLGAGVIDRLRELAPNPEIIVPINFGGKPLDALKYRNKKAEMWGEMKAWLSQDDEPVQIPDSDELQADLCNTKYRVDSNNRLEMESKEHQKARGIRSSDMADALALTFGVPAHALNASIKNNQASILDGLVSSFEKTRGAIERSRR